MSSYAVLVPWIETEKGNALLFEVRAEGVSQPGEVCFPGGRIEEGETPAETAVRETCEELGLTPEHIKVLEELPPEKSRHGRAVFPIVAKIRTEDISEMRLSKDEVAKVFLVPESWLRENPPARYDLSILTDDQLPAGLRRYTKSYDIYNRQYCTDYYEYDDYGIWGLTARILTHYLKRKRVSETR